MICIRRVHAVDAQCMQANLVAFALELHRLRNLPQLRYSGCGHQTATVISDILSVDQLCRDLPLLV